MPYLNIGWNRKKNKVSDSTAELDDNFRSKPAMVLGKWLAASMRRLRPYQPRFNDWRFWAIQGLVFVVAATHAIAEILKMSGHPIFVGEEPRVALASFVTVSLFFVPVVYAALNFGFAGSVATALWCTILTMPNLTVYHHGAELAREAIQIAIVDAIAVFVGQRVDREISARQTAEASESKYRGLFESSSLPVIIADKSGAVLEVNPAARSLFGAILSSMNNITLDNLLGKYCTQQVLSSAPKGNCQEIILHLGPKKDYPTYLEPTFTSISDSEGIRSYQILLKDVTEERLRQAGLRAYAAQILRAQEDERQRIAQELHDDSIQMLVLLCRRLDAVESDEHNLPAKSAREIQEARRTAEDVAEGLRNFAKALRPPVLEDLGLVTSIRRLLLDLTERSQIKGHMLVEGEERRLSPDVELGLFRITQESLRNVERHSQATQVTVTLRFKNDGIFLSVQDNGAGFIVPANLVSFEGNKLGLLGINERTQLIGGNLDIESRLGYGTVVAVTLPATARKP